MANTPQGCDVESIRWIKDKALCDDMETQKIDKLFVTRSKSHGKTSGQSPTLTKSAKHERDSRQSPTHLGMSQ